jgi:hypothetical protein
MGSIPRLITPVIPDEVDAFDAGDALQGLGVSVLATGR